MFLFFFFFFFSVQSTAAVNGQRGADVTRADVSVTSLGLTWQQRRNTREVRGGSDLRVGARARVAGKPETSGGAWGRVRGWIRPIFVAMDKS